MVTDDPVKFAVLGRDLQTPEAGETVEDLTMPGAPGHNLYVTTEQLLSEMMVANGRDVPNFSPTALAMPETGGDTDDSDMAAAGASVGTAAANESDVAEEGDRDEGTDASDGMDGIAHERASGGGGAGEEDAAPEPEAPSETAIEDTAPEGDDASPGARENLILEYVRPVAAVSIADILEVASHMDEEGPNGEGRQGVSIGGFFAVEDGGPAPAEPAETMLGHVDGIGLLSADFVI